MRASSTTLRTWRPTRVPYSNRTRPYGSAGTPGPSCGGPPASATCGSRPLFQTTPAGLASAYDTVREAAERHGRDRDAVGLALRVLVDLRDEPDRAGAERRGALLGPPEQVVETLAEYQRAGVSHFVFLPQARTLSDVQRTVAMLAEQVAPQLRQVEDGA